MENMITIPKDRPFVEREIEQYERLFKATAVSFERYRKTFSVQGMDREFIRLKDVGTAFEFNHGKLTAIHAGR